MTKKIKKRKKPIQFKVTQEEKFILENLSKRLGVNKSAMLRLLLHMESQRFIMINNVVEKKNIDNLSPLEY